VINRIFFSFVLLAFLVVASGCSNKSGRVNPLLTSKADQKNPGFNRSGSSVPLDEFGKLKSEEIENQEDLRAIRVIYFDYDNATVSSEFRQVLEAHAAYLIDNFAARVVLEGHTDERGTREYNLALGENRALSVKRQLSIMGVRDAQMDLVSFGEERPEMLGQGEEVFSLNRRVELVY
tara:strand:+ start:5 stop:538 length:534 start_codon:yes stop_codon:yes gene_type:complete